MFRTTLTLILLLVVTSCIPKKRLTYLQGEPSQEKLNLAEIEPYRLQVDDILYVNVSATNQELVEVFNGGNQQNNGNRVFSSDNLYFDGYSVDRHGMIDLPVLGKMNVLGYTVDEVKSQVTEDLSVYFKRDSELFVEVKLAGIKYTIVGEVRSTGTKTINQNRLNIIEAVANAGDITDVGDRKNVEVFRVVDDELKKYSIDLTQVDAFDSDIFLVKPNDIISVPPLKQKTWGTGTNTVQTITTLLSVFSLLTSTYLLAKSL